MAYYDALIAKWGTLSGTTAQKLAAINAATVPGPNVDVPASQVVRYLGVNGKLATLLNYAKNPPATAAGVAAAELAAALSMGTNAPPFYMSQAADYAAMSAMLNALAGDTNSGITSTDVSNLLALSATTVPWASAPVAAGGGGLRSATVNGHDLVAAGITVLTLSAPTPAGSSVLTFASVPSWVVQDMEVHDLGLDQADLPPGTVVQSITSTTVEVSNPAQGAGLAVGDVIGFAAV